MCFGGGGSRATITMPNTSAYDRQAEMQLDLMRQQQQGVMSLKRMCMRAVEELSTTTTTTHRTAAFRHRHSRATRRSIGRPGLSPRRRCFGRAPLRAA